MWLVRTSFFRRFESSLSILHYVLNVTIDHSVFKYRYIRASPLVLFIMIVDRAPRSLLLELPVEIRLEIWTHLFSTPTGRVVLATRSRQDLTHGHVIPWDHLDWEDYKQGYAKWNGMFRQRDQPRIISFSILKTCKQIYSETGDMLWKLNTLLFPPGDYLDMWSNHDGNKIRLINQAVHVQLDIDFLDVVEVKRLREGLECLENWGSENLKMVTVSPARGFLNVLNLGGLRDNPSDYLRHFDDEFPNGTFPAILEVLKDARIEMENLNLKRRIVIETGWYSLSADSQIYSTRSTPSDFLSCQRKLSTSGFQPVLDALKDLHEAFGGELWQDGTLCYKDGVQISQPFKLQPGAEEACDEKDRKLIDDSIKRRICGLNRKLCTVVEAMERRMAEQEPPEPPDLARKFIYEDDVIDELAEYRCPWMDDPPDEWDGLYGLKKWCVLDHPAFAILKDWHKGRHINHSDFLSNDAIQQAIQYPGVMGLLGWRPGMEA